MNAAMRAIPRRRSEARSSVLSSAIWAARRSLRVCVDQKSEQRNRRQKSPNRRCTISAICALSVEFRSVFELNRRRCPFPGAPPVVEASTGHLAVELSAAFSAKLGMLWADPLVGLVDVGREPLPLPLLHIFLND